MKLRIAVLALQGDISEHLEALKRAGADAFPARFPADLEAADGAVIPGGESTTISALIFERGLDAELRRLVEEGRPVWGTCAGMVVLASRGCRDVEGIGQRLLGIVDAGVERNAFGGQRLSFQTRIDVGSVEDFPGVFIRAPRYVEVGPDVEVLTEFDGKIVAARQGNVLATAFHPELVEDTRVHEYFLRMVEEKESP